MIGRFVTLGASVLLVCFPSPGTAQLAQTDSGAVAGATVDGIASWKGIPFAQPPVGALRWRAPQPPKPWDGERPATEFGHDCMQIPFVADAAPLGTPPAEDCLYLNVWRPADAKPGDRLPVMLWIYGGGLVNGGASPAVYDGAELARQGVVLVSFNYRLGRFGFFAHPALSAANEDNGLLGNYGYLDQIAALHWVQRNIGAFGGNPGNVTIFGESAGGGSVSMMMAAPMARGGFAKAIVMSGGGRNQRADLPVHSDSGPDGEDAGTGFAQWAGVTGDGAEALAALRALPAETVVEGIGIGQKQVAPSSGPMIDGFLLQASPPQVYSAGNAAPVPFMAGANSADLGVVTGESDAELFAGAFGPLATRARAAYAGLDAKTQRSAIGADAVMVEPARRMVQAMVRAGQPAWYYRAGYVPQAMRAQWPLLPHANEIPFFFRTLEARYPGETTPADLAMAAAMSAAFVNFAKTGDPNGAPASATGVPAWPAYDDLTRPVMLFGMEQAVGGADPWRARLDVTEAASDARETAAR